MSDVFRPLQPAPGSREWSKEIIKTHCPHMYQTHHLRCCEHCNKVARDLPACAGCGQTFATTFYCNRRCQRADWDTHKVGCKRVQSLSKLHPLPTFKKARREYANQPYLASYIAINWAAIQAYMANPQQDPKKTYVKIKVTKFKFGNIEINLFPVCFGFSPLSPTTRLPKKGPGEDHYGYWSNDLEGGSGNELHLIQSADSYPDFMRQPVPQWPYIFAKVLQANECEAKNSLEFLVYIIKTVADHKDMNYGLEEFTAPKIDDLWHIDIDKFYRWMRLTRNVASV